jgi:hypothetical protein
VGEETARLTALVPVIGLFAMGVVWDSEGVLVLGARAVGGDHWGNVPHSFANLGHAVVLQVDFILLLLLMTLKALFDAFVEVMRVFLACTLKETCAGQGHELVSLIFASEGSFGNLFGSLNPRRQLDMGPCAMK